MTTKTTVVLMDKMTTKAALLFYYPEETESDHQDRLIQRQLTVVTSIGKALFGTIEEYHCPRVLRIDEACKQIGSSEVTTILCFVLCVPLDKKSSGDLCFKLDRKNKLQLQQHLLTPLLQARPQGDELNVYVSIDTTFVDPLLKVPKAEALLPGMDALCEAARLTDGGRMKLAIVAGCKGKPPTGVDTEAKDEGSELDSDDEGEYSYMPAVPRFTEIAIAALLKAFEVGDVMAASITNVQQIANKYLLRAYEIHNMKKGDVRPKLCDLIQCSSASPFLQLSPEAQDLIRCGAHFPRADNFFAPYDDVRGRKSLPLRCATPSPLLPMQQSSGSVVPSQNSLPLTPMLQHSTVPGINNNGRGVRPPQRLVDYNPQRGESLQAVAQKFATSVEELKVLNTFTQALSPFVELRPQNLKIPVFEHTVETGEDVLSIFNRFVSSGSVAQREKYRLLNGWRSLELGHVVPGGRVLLPYDISIRGAAAAAAGSGVSAATNPTTGAGSGYSSSSSVLRMKGIPADKVIVPIGRHASPAMHPNSGARICPSCDVDIPKEESWTEHVGSELHLAATQNDVSTEHYLCRVCHLTISGSKNNTLHEEGSRHKRTLDMAKQCPDCRLLFLQLDDFTDHRRNGECTGSGCGTRAGGGTESDEPFCKGKSLLPSGVTGGLSPLWPSLDD